MNTLQVLGAHEGEGLVGVVGVVGAACCLTVFCISMLCAMQMHVICTDTHTYTRAHTPTLSQTHVYTHTHTHTHIHTHTHTRTDTDTCMYTQALEAGLMGVAGSKSHHLGNRGAQVSFKFGGGEEKSKLGRREEEGGQEIPPLMMTKERQQRSSGEAQGWIGKRVVAVLTLNTFLD